MKLRTAFRKAAEKIFKVKIYRTTPRGVNVASDIRGAFPGLKVTTVFDIGANVGQSVEHFLTDFPEAQIVSFEPSQTTFEQLQMRFQGEARVLCYRYALSDRIGSADMELTEASDLRRLLPNALNRGGSDFVESVNLITLDAFCIEHSINKIDFLKVDTEGHELQVLSGAEQMLDKNAIAILELELGMNPDNCRHTRFEEAKEVLEKKGYRIFSITEQTPEFPTNRANLRRVNALFVSQGLISL